MHAIFYVNINCKQISQNWTLNKTVNKISYNYFILCKEQYNYYIFNIKW